MQLKVRLIPREDSSAIAQSLQENIKLKTWEVSFKPN